MEATKLDQYLSIAYFQNGVANVALEEYSKALQCFHDAFLVSSFHFPFTQNGFARKISSFFFVL